MKLTLRAVALSTFLTAFVAVGLFAYPSAAEEARADFWQVVDDQRRINAAEETARLLDRDTELAARRIAVRQEVVRDVANGRMTFEEGTRRFAELNRTLPAAVAHYSRQRFPGRTEEEWAAQQLICHLQTTLDPAAVALAEEWECMLAGRE